MTRVMLDTSAYSACFRGQREVKLALQRAEEIFLNSTVLGELLAGSLRGKRRGKNEGNSDDSSHHRTCTFRP